MKQTINGWVVEERKSMILFFFKNKPKEIVNGWRDKGDRGIPLPAALYDVMKDYTEPKKCTITTEIED